MQHMPPPAPLTAVNPDFWKAALQVLSECKHAEKLAKENRMLPFQPDTAPPSENFRLVANVSTFLTAVADSVRKMWVMEKDLNLFTRVDGEKTAAGADNIRILQEAIKWEQGVESAVVIEALEAVTDNLKQLETDPKPLTTSLQMWKAVRPQVITLAAWGMAKQIAWADQQQPFFTFSEMMDAAGGSLGNIIKLTSPEQPDRQSAEIQYTERLTAAKTERRARDEAIWKKVHEQCKAAGYDIPEKPIRLLTEHVQTDCSKTDAFTTFLTNVGCSLDDARTCAYSVHKLWWLFPWTEH
eukprot:769365-Rhodomonas_salina.2